ncbi:YjdF family protein [Streptococcus macacae]|uniref:PF11208 family protein n=1 Tax=Streptococcus macacae NCTC 11558 TaxID=764298 RepID=G5JX66_9STRE|nr:YjdF family protein [Streptococcus macacae]EHJ52505.1 hypothetical protein STRMA_1935 [Streptococcus macacae NCTC 11558]SUN77839.1 Protein of uncharacterised function (DUF2992) [Streptococcus macacae NCTC 11558]
MKLTVYFDGTFWFALVEHVNCKGQYKAFRYPFGKEPKDFDVWYFILKELPRLIKKYDSIETDSYAHELPQPKKMNPKRMQRALNKSKKQGAISTKAQVEMKKLHQALKKEKKTQNKEKRQALKRYQYQLKQEKRHQKKQGH